MNHNQVTPSPCPYCGKVHDGASSYDGQAGGPQEGDFSVCISCAEICRFDKDLQREKVTQAELVIYSLELLRQLKQAQAIVNRLLLNKKVEETPPS